MIVTLAAALLSVARPDWGSAILSGPPPQSNALLQFASNKFDTWTLSHRVEMPEGGNRIEVAPMPQRIGR